MDFLRYAVRQSSSPMGSLLPQIQGGHHHEQTKLEKRFLYFMDRTGYHRLGGLIRRAKSKMDDEYWISILEKQIISIKSGAVL